jgi:predicted permease
MSFTNALTTAVLPVLAIAFVGFVVGRQFEFEVKALSLVTIYVLAPALVFDSMATTSLAGDQILILVLGVALVTVGMAVVGEGAAWLNETDGSKRNGLVLASTFSNCGNYGIPLAAFAFGAVGRNTAVLYLVGQNIFMYTLGVYLAARGSESSNLEGVKEIFRLPLVYALVAAVFARQFNLLPPVDSTISETIALTGNAAIPIMLLLVGIQLARTEHQATFRQMALPNTLRLGVSPVVAIGIALVIGFADDTVGRVFILLSGTPVAITPLILALEYEEGMGDVTSSEYLSTAIFSSTLLSIPTSALLITVLQSGAIV